MKAFSSIFCVIFTINFYSQNIPSEYYTLTNRADSFYKIKNFKESTLLFSKAFSFLGGKGLIHDRYTAAKGWAIRSNPDSAFNILLKIKNQLKTYSILTDTEFVFLHNDPRWKLIKNQIKSDERLLKKNAIKCDCLDVINKNLYSFINKYKCISIGEMHGTLEPTKFLIGIVKTLQFKNKTVIVGFEIPEWSVKSYLLQQDKNGLSESDFFKKGSSDGRSSVAWFEAINEFQELGVKLCFYSNVTDSMMALKLINFYEQDTNSILLTISGNVHNMIGSYNKKKRMGLYLKEYFGEEYLSIVHFYGKGSMFNMTSDGLKIHKVENTNGIFYNSIKYSNYYLPNVFLDYMKEYDGILYTRIITASLPFKRYLDVLPQ